MVDVRHNAQLMSPEVDDMLHLQLFWDLVDRVAEANLAVAVRLTGHPVGPRAVGVQGALAECRVPSAGGGQCRQRVSGLDRGPVEP